MCIRDSSVIDREDMFKFGNINADINHSANLLFNVVMCSIHDPYITKPGSKCEFNRLI